MGREPLAPDEVEAQPTVVHHVGRDDVHRRITQERGHRDVDRAVVELEWRSHLLEVPVVEDRDPVGQHHGVLLVGGHQEGGRAVLVLDVSQVRPQLGPQVQVDAGQRLVEQQHPRSSDHRPGELHGLHLTSRELVASPVQQV